jgi:hypothetical protein
MRSKDAPRISQVKQIRCHLLHTRKGVIKLEKNLEYDVIKKEFYHKALIYSGMHLYFNSGAIEVITRCKELNKKINAIEAFRIRTSGIQPSQIHSTWFKCNSDNGFWKEAIDFIKIREDTEFVFEIFYDGYD